MKQLLLLLAGITVSIAETNAQASYSPFNTIDSVDVNNIHASVLVHGDMWWDPVTEVSKCNHHGAPGKNIAFGSSIWMSGYDGGGQLHVAAQTYRQNGTDYWPGPLETSDTISYAESAKWATIWKVNVAQISGFLSIATHTVANTPAVILQWPGAGNTYAAGAGGAALTLPAGRPMAPFVDLNSNGIYEPLAGEYPAIKGDQFLWWVYNDNGVTHNETGGQPLGVEVHASSYGYNRGTLIDNVVYYEYKINNRSTNNYSNYRIGQFADMDLGHYLDDFIGFDSSRRLGIVYNGTAIDGYATGTPTFFFNNRPPVAGVTMVVLPGDAGSAYVPVGTFSYYNNDNTIIGNPAAAADYDNYLRSKLRDGSPFTNDFTGRGIATSGHGSGPAINYVYPGDPADTTAWSECNSNNTPGDRRFIITSNSFSLAAGATQTVVMALVMTDPDTNNACDRLNYNGIKEVADTAWRIYHNPLPTTLGICGGGLHQNITVAPNPAVSTVRVSGLPENFDARSLSVMNMLGQQMVARSRKLDNAVELDVSSCPPGIYMIYAGEGGSPVRFVKQ